MPDKSLGLNPRLTIDREKVHVEHRLAQDPLYDFISGTPGDDFLVGSNDDDTITGGAGNDQVLGRGGNDNIDGDPGHDFLRGDRGDDGLFGGDGDDYLRGGEGNDTVNGQGGFDRAAFFDSTVGVHVSLLIAGPQDTGQGIDWLIDIDHLSGTRHDDKLIGDGGDNWLWGDISAFDPPTGGGNDTLLGGDGDDLLDVASGNHRLIGGDGIDTVTVLGGTTDTLGGVTIDLNLQGSVQDTGQGMMFLKQVENLSGSVHGDALIGDSLANLLAGHEGEDTLKGGGGADTLYGDGVVRIESAVGTSGPIVVLEQETVGGVAGEDQLFGGGGGDRLIGGLADDLLEGGGRGDILIGGEGGDFKEGGSGRDFFVYEAVGDSVVSNRDLVLDFTMRDQVDVKQIDADISTAGNEDFHFVGAFTGAAAEAWLHYDRTLDLTLLELDVDGDAVADSVIAFTGFVSTFYDFNGIS